MVARGHAGAIPVVHRPETRHSPSDTPPNCVIYSLEPRLRVKNLSVCTRSYHRETILPVLPDETSGAKIGPLLGSLLLFSRVHSAPLEGHTRFLDLGKDHPHNHKGNQALRIWPKATRPSHRCVASRG
jgi:hypothetical protein